MQDFLALVGRELPEANSHNFRNPEFVLGVDEVGKEITTANLGQFLQGWSEIAEPRPQRRQDSNLPCQVGTLHDLLRCARAPVSEQERSDQEQTGNRLTLGTSLRPFGDRLRCPDSAVGITFAQGMTNQSKHCLSRDV